MAFHGNAAASLEKTGAKKGIDIEAGVKRRTSQGISLRTKTRKMALGEKRHMGHENRTLPQDVTNPMAYPDDLSPDVLPRELIPNILLTLQNLSKSLESAVPVSQEVIAATQLKCTRLLKRFCNRTPSESEFVVANQGLTGFLIHCLSADDRPELEEEALHALTAICSASHFAKTHVVENGGVPALTRYLRADNPQWRSAAAFALGSLASEGPKNRDKLMESGAFTCLLNLIQNAATEIPEGLQNIIFALACVVRHRPYPPLETIEPCIGFLAQMAFHQDEKVISEALWALSYISDGEKRIKPVIETGILPTAVMYLRSSNIDLQLPAIRLVGNFAQGDDEYLDQVLQANALADVPMLMAHTNPKIRKETAWLVSNVAAGTRDQIQWLVNSGLCVTMLPFLKAPELAVRREAMWTFTNVLEAGTVTQVQYLISTGFLVPYAELLNDNDMKLVETVLKGLYFLLNDGIEAEEQLGLDANPYAQMITELGILDMIEKCVIYSSNKVVSEAEKILDDFFSYEQYEDGILNFRPPDNLGNEGEYGANAPFDFDE